jgi:ABC-type transport system substrate-binding protein
MSHVVIEQVYSTLMALDPDAKPYPELAESYEVSDDGLQYTFKLRSDVTFHNGDELTAEDVKFSFDRLRAKDSGYSYGSQVETIASVDAVDKRTVSFRLSRRTGPFLVYMAFPGSSIVPKKLVESGHDLNATPVGSGPFKFVSYEPRSAIKFERNPHYFQEGKPYFGAMEYRIIPDVTALTSAVTSGEVNFSNEIPPKDWASVTTAPNLKTRLSKGPATTGFCRTAPRSRSTIRKSARRLASHSIARRSSPAASSAKPRLFSAVSFPSGTGPIRTPNFSVNAPRQRRRRPYWRRPASRTVSKQA